MTQSAKSAPKGKSPTSRRGGSRPSSGRPKVPPEQDAQRFEIACWWAFVEEGLGSFDAARRALLAVRGGPFTVEDIEGLAHLANAEIPLPTPFDPLDSDKGLRRLAAKAKRATEREPPSEWLNRSAGTIGALLVFVRESNTAGECAALDILIELGWGPVILGLVKRIQAALGSNLAPADLEKLSPAVHRWLAQRRAEQKKSTFD
jgi:hypothetical protein